MPTIGGSVLGLLIRYLVELSATVPRVMILIIRQDP